MNDIELKNRILNALSDYFWARYDDTKRADFEIFIKSPSGLQTQFYLELLQDDDKIKSQLKICRCETFVPISRERFMKAKKDIKLYLEMPGIVRALQTKYIHLEAQILEPTAQTIQSFNKRFIL